MCKLTLNIDNDDGQALEYIKYFKEWTKNRLTQWDKSILEYFLYEYNLPQDPDGTKYNLDFHIEEILKDDSVEKKFSDDYQEENNKNE